MAARVSRANKAHRMAYLEAKEAALEERVTALCAELSNRGYTGPLLNDIVVPDEVDSA